ncbi:extracellular solute-binding protein [Brooklawnia cerclae]|uniref:Multiple sugar transport system substrate-binding protein n=1 Tax=Brooklawnia cerclae TaxID=349934 RepID=A0ABX0SEK2_9ACTN|nr:extracellular solute-binding protein [Brooklawnia cerclae]NIH56838.1 multiple sugar transport system substrate-binding protein [Brooklawnia cerclae]
MGAFDNRISRRFMLQAGGVALGSWALAGCVSPTAGDSEASGSAASSPLKPDSGDVTGELTILDDNTNLVFQDGLIDVFQEQTGITVKTYEMGNFNDLHDRFATLFAAQDSSFDIIMTWAGWSAEFGKAGWLQELDSSALPSDLIRPALDAVSWDSKVYGMPKFASVQTMFWNKEHFSAAGLDPDTVPENWDDFVAAAKACTTADHYGYCCDMGNPAGAYQNYLRALLLAGGELYDADWNPQLNSEAGIEGLTKMVELLNLHKAMDPASLQITNASDLNDVFAQGNTSIVFNWPFQWAAATKDGAKTTAATTGNGLIPGINVRSASIDGSEGYAINVNSPNKQAALKWLQFASSATAQAQIVGQEGWFPVSQTTLDDPATAEALPVVTTYKQSTDYVTKRYGTPWSSELDQLLSVQVNQAMNQQITPEEALNNAQEELKPIVERYMA